MTITTTTAITTEAATVENSMTPDVPEPLKRFLWDIQSMVELADSEREILIVGHDLMTRLVASDDWLPAVFATSNPAAVQQYQLYRDDLERFTVVSTILSPGQISPIVHAPVWEIAGVLRGGIERKHFGISGGGLPVPKGEPGIKRATAVNVFSSKSGDAVQLRNALDDSVSISINVYGAELGTLTRQTIAPDGAVIESAVTYANGEALPPYDIRSIQTRYVD